MSISRTNLYINNTFSSIQQSAKGSSGIEALSFVSDVLPDEKSDDQSLKKLVNPHEILKALFKLLFAYGGYKTLPLLKNRFSNSSVTERLSKVKENYIDPKSRELNEKVEEMFGIKFDVTNPLEMLRQFIGLDLSNSAIGLIGGFGFGAFLVSLYNNFQGKDLSNFNDVATVVEVQNKKGLPKNFFDKFVEFSIKLISSLTFAHWFQTKFKNPFAEFVGLVLGYGIGEAITLFDEFMKDKIYKIIGPPLEKLTGTKINEKDDPRKQWNFAASLARSFSLAVLVFLKYIVFLPKKKLLFYQAQYEPLKKTKNDFIFSANNNLKLQIAPTKIVSSAHFDPEAIPSQNIEYTYDWVDSTLKTFRKHSGSQNFVLNSIVQAYLRQLKMVLNTVRSPKFARVAATESSSKKEKINALIQDSGRNIAFKLPLSFLIVFYATAAEFILHLLTPLWDSIKSFFGHKDQEHLDNKQDHRKQKLFNSTT